MRFLYIEDSLDNHFLIDFYLKSLGIELVCTETIEEGMKLLDSTPFDAILLDLNLPGKLTSWNLLDQLKKQQLLSKIKVWVISAMQLSEVLPRIEGYEGVDFIRKPIKKAEFASLVKAAFPEEFA